MAETTELKFTDKGRLPNINGIIDNNAHNKEAKQKLKSASNKFKGTGKTEKQNNYNGSPNDCLIDIDNILSPTDIEPLTMEYLETILGKKRVDAEVKKSVLERMNIIIKNEHPDIAKYFRDTCIDVIDTMFGIGSKISLRDYVNAALFVTYRAAGSSKIQAYTKVFPERVQRMQREQQNMGHLNSYADIYSKGKAVVDIQAKVMLPVYLVCHDLFFQALRVTTEIMTDDRVSPKVRVDAANNIMTYTRPPEMKKNELSINIQENDDILQLKEAMLLLAQNQSKQIDGGAYTVVDASKQTIYIEDKKGN